MKNRDKAIEVLTNTFGVEFEKRLKDMFKGCEFIQSTQCNTYQDCEHCKRFHFWYNEYTGLGTAEDISKEAIVKEFKIKVRDIIEEESKKTNAEGEYIYSLSEERLFIKLIDIIWRTNV